MLGRLLPPSLGRPYRWLFASSTATNLGDGILLAAGPLLVASLTRDPFAVAMSVLAQRLPWVLFGLVAGAVVDRVNRVRLVAAADALRVLVLGALTVMVALDAMTVPGLYAVFFLLGTAETFADNASSTLTVAVVRREHLGLANSRLFGSAMVTNQLAGPSVGAALFAVAGWTAFGATAVLCALGVVLVLRVTLPPRAEPEGPQESAGTLLRQTREGLSWLWHHPPMRTLTVMILGFNVTFGAAWSVLVLYAQDRLGVGDVGYGLLLSASAVGGVLGSALFPRLEARFRYAVLLRVGLVIETGTHAALALTEQAWVAGLVVFAFGVHAVVWGSTSTTVRQRAVPDALLGRVTGVYLLASLGGIAAGTPIGGWVAQQWGITAALWFAFGGSLVLTALLWRSLTYVAHAAEEPQPRG